jgi:DNA-binding GntR family transcriptional regulator
MIDFVVKIQEPKLVVSQVADGLRELITSGRLKPGEKLKESEISSSFGVSRFPVREAFRILELEGLMDLIPRKGAYIHKITTEDVREIYQIREMVEGFAGYLATENMTDEDIAEVEQLWLKMKSLTGSGDFENYLSASSDFHNKIIICAQNKRLVEIYHNIRATVKFLRSYILSSGKRMDSSLSEHQQIVEAIKKRDKDLVEKMSRAHVRKGRENFMSLIAHQGICLSSFPSISHLLIDQDDGKSVDVRRFLHQDQEGRTDPLRRTAVAANPGDLTGSFELASQGPEDRDSLPRSLDRLVDGAHQLIPARHDEDSLRTGTEAGYPISSAI